MKYLNTISLLFLLSCSSSPKERDFPLHSCIFYNKMIAYIVDKDIVNYTLYSNLQGQYYLFKESRQTLIELASPIKCQPHNLEGLKKVLN